MMGCSDDNCSDPPVVVMVPVDDVEHTKDGDASEDEEEVTRFTVAMERGDEEEEEEDEGVEDGDGVGVVVGVVGVVSDTGGLTGRWPRPDRSLPPPPELLLGLGLGEEVGVLGVVAIG